jgi:hypothetical protein
MEMSRARPGQTELIEMPGQMEFNEGRGIVQIGLEEDQRLAEKILHPPCGKVNGPHVAGMVLVTVLMTW